MLTLLKVQTIKMLKVPSPICLSNLKKLELNCFEFPDDHLTEQLFSGCPILTQRFKHYTCLTVCNSWKWPWILILQRWILLWVIHLQCCLTRGGAHLPSFIYWEIKTSFLRFCFVILLKSITHVSKLILGCDSALGCMLLSIVSKFQCLQQVVLLHHHQNFLYS